MRPHFRDVLYVAVAAVFTLAVITAVYLTVFKPAFANPVSCTVATHCTPGQPLPPPGPEHPDG